MNLNKSTLFCNISLKDCKRMLHCLHAQTKHFETGAIIHDFRSERTEVGIVNAGTARLQRVDMNGYLSILERLDEGNVFGETIAFSNKGEDSFSIVSETPCTIIFISYAHITRPCSKVCPCHTTLLNNMLAIISNKTMELSRRIEVLTNRSIRDKLLYYFRLQSSAVNGSSFFLPFSMSALADYLCIDRSAMMRELKKMKEANLIQINGKEITLIS